MASNTESCNLNLENGIEVFQKICKYLESKNVVFKQISHEPTFTSEESAKARGEDLSIGGKAILMKADTSFVLFVLSASRKIDSKKIKGHLNAKKIRFSTSEELFTLTNLVPGSVPPFGSPILPLKLYVDKGITTNDKIAFNAGLLTKSIVMTMDDYLSAANAELFDFSE